MLPLEIVTPFKRYQPVGRCIYCDRWRNTLTKEHIIPFGLASDSLVLYKASCRKCNKHTHEFETLCLRQMWWPFRYRMGVPSRSKEVPDKFLLRRIKVTAFSESNQTLMYEKGDTLEVEPSEYPLHYLAFKFHPPGVLIDRPDSDWDYDGFILRNEDDRRKYVPNDRDGFRIGPGNWQAFCKLLAKIAHSYAVAELGLRAFRPTLTGFIRGASIPIFRWIGGDIDVAEATDPLSLHEIGIRQEVAAGISYVVVSLRLFSGLGCPRYDIVVGQLNPDFEQITLLQKPLYRISIKTPIPVGQFVPHILPSLGRTWG